MDEFGLYIGGMSIPEVSEKTGIPLSTLRFRFKKAGILRTRAEGVKAAGEKGKLGSGLRGKKRNFSEEWKQNIRLAKLEDGKLNSNSIRINANGYAEFTRGENKGRGVHCVVMEARLGRKLYSDECVHHIDGEKLNNSDDNLALVTKAGHSRLHRFEDAISGKQKRRNENGTWR